MKLNERNLLNNLNENAKEIEQLKREKLDSIRNYKNEAVHQIESLMETLLAKDDIIQVCTHSFFTQYCLIYFYFVLKQLEFKIKNCNCQQVRIYFILFKLQG